MSILSAVKGVAGVASLANPVGFANAGINKLSGGRYGIDPTPGYGAANVINTQLRRATTGGSAQTPQKPGGNNNGTNNFTTQSSLASNDRYAPWGGQAKYQALVDGFNNQKSNIYTSATDAANATGSQLGRSILDFLDSQRLAQKKINEQAARNELAKQQGVSGVIGAVGRGIKSGGVMLANKNAGDSSAAGALANAYGDQGRRQLADVGNQYELGNQEIQSAQDQFGVQQASGVRNIQGTKQDAINNIVNSARDKFAQLDAAMANASLPERIAIDQERENVRGQVVGLLQQYDQQLTQGLGDIHAATKDESRAAGAQLGSAGTDLGKDAFNYTTEIPAEQQGTGPYASELPLFSLNRGKRTVA